ncbi:hypothetical protein Tco_1399896 [Tanacetum coccineum]
MIDWLSIVETDKMIHTIETDIVKLVVEIKSFGKSSNEFDKVTVSLDELQLRNFVNLPCTAIVKPPCTAIVKPPYTFTAKPPCQTTFTCRAIKQPSKA